MKGPRAASTLPREADQLPAPILADPNPGLRRLALHVVYDLAWLLVIAVSSVYWIPRWILDRGFGHMARHRLGFHWPKLERGQKRILVHGVSVGEVKGAQSLIRGLRERYPEFEIVVSTTTNTGESVARDLYPDLTIVRFPVDISFIVRHFLRRIDPTVVVLIELEIWPNFLRYANRHGAPICVVNGRITERSFRAYRLFRHLMPQFNRISLFSSQNEEYAERFGRLVGCSDRICVCGNIKVDGLQIEHVDPPAELARELGVAEGQFVFVAGSTHNPEEKWLTEVWLKAAVESRLILVPRHPERAREIVSQLASLGVTAQRLTELRSGVQRPNPSQPLVVDTIGELEKIYGLAHVVFVGGSLIPHGGQNMLEPAAQGRAVVYGPHVRNFYQEAAMLEAAGGSERVEDVSSLTEVIEELIADTERRKRMGAAGREVVEAQKGATRLTLEALHVRCFSSLAAHHATEPAAGLGAAPS